MMPLPIVLAFAILLGWPSLKLAANVVSLPLWRELKEIRRGLLADAGLTDEDRAQVERIFTSAYGHPMEVLMPLIALVGIPVLAMTASRAGNYREKMREYVRAQSSGLKDPFYNYRLKIFQLKKYWDMELISFELGMLRYPGSALLTVFVTILCMPLLLLAFGMHVSVTRVVSIVFKSSTISGGMFTRSMMGT
jgi:hypothetical protein